MKREMKSPITTHVLDTALGRPAAGVAVRLERLGAGGEAETLARGITDDDGRIGTLLEPGSLRVGPHRITFDTGAYFDATGQRGFYPEVSVVFVVEEPSAHHHVPLLLSPFGYSTYRGS
jgi:5-hydroxyisourate hydrolase